MRRRHRLGSAAVISRVRAKGRSVRRPEVAVTALAVDGDAPPRFAVIASRRVGTAVDRNRARRRIRAALSALVPSIQPGLVATVSATPKTNRVDFQDLAESLRIALAKAIMQASKGVPNGA